MVLCTSDLRFQCSKVKRASGLKSVGDLSIPGSGWNPEEHNLSVDYAEQKSTPLPPHI